MAVVFFATQHEFRQWLEEHHQTETELLAWEFFCAQPPSYRKPRISWIMAAKQEQTRLSRLDKLIEASERKQRLY